MSATRGSGVASQSLVWAAGAYPARPANGPVRWVGPARPSFSQAKDGDTWIQSKGGLLSEIASLPGLVGYWPCNEGTGTTVHDRATAPVDGTISGAGVVLAPWNQPGGVNALGLKPYGGAGKLTIPADPKFNLGDTFTVGVLFRRRALNVGTVFQHGAALYGVLGSELLSNADFESAPSSSSAIGNWKAINSAGAVTQDASVFHGGAHSFKVAIDSSNTVQGFNQIIPSAQPGRYSYSWWGLDDGSNVLGKHDLQVAYTPAAGGSALNLQPNGTWAVGAADVFAGTHDAVWTLHTVTFDLPELTASGNGGLSVTMKRQPGAGGGVAYNFWIDDASLKLAPATPGAYAVDTSTAGVFALKVPITGQGIVTVATSPAEVDHLAWHLLVVTKSGATTRINFDGTDVTVPGVNATVGSSGSAANIIFGGDFGQFDCVGAHAFLVNRAITLNEIAAIKAEANLVPDRNPNNLKIGSNNYSLTTLMDGYRATYAANLRALGVTFSREAFLWSQVQSANSSTFDWTRLDDLVNSLGAQNIEIYAMFDTAPTWATGNANTRWVPTDAPLVKGLSVAAAGTSWATWRDAWVTFMVACVNRYKDRVHTWEILNEQNAEIFSAPAASAPLYVNFYNTARAAILAADPTAHVVAAGLARVLSDAGTTTSTAYTADEWVRALMDGGIGQIDAMPTHPYPVNNQSALVHTTNQVNVDAHLRIRDTFVEYGRPNTKVYINEIGWYTGNFTIAPAMNGLSFPQTVLSIVDSANIIGSFPSSGTVFVLTNTGVATVTYTGKTTGASPTLTGCSTTSTGTLTTGYPVSIGFGSSPITELVQGQRLYEAVGVVRDYFSAFGDYFGIFSLNVANSTTDPFGGCALYYDFPMTVAKRAGIAALTDAATPYRAQRNAITPPVVAPVYPPAYVASSGSWLRVSA